MRRLELAGEKFGRLLVIEQSGKKDGRLLWRCECEYGNEAVVPGYRLVQKKNALQSCGCMRGKGVTHGHTKNKRQTSEYRTWRYVIEDCDYQPWATDFERFLSDVGERPSPKHQARKYDFRWPYAKDNFVWQVGRGFDHCRIILRD